jgi:hypothetical protein
MRSKQRRGGGEEGRKGEREKRGREEYIRWIYRYIIIYIDVY